MPLDSTTIEIAGCTVTLTARRDRPQPVAAGERRTVFIDVRAELAPSGRADWTARFGTRTPATAELRAWAAVYLDGSALKLEPGSNVLAIVVDALSRVPAPRRLVETERSRLSAAATELALATARQR